MRSHHSKDHDDTADVLTSLTRSLVLHPDIQSADSPRDPGLALEEAVALAAALPGLEVVAAEVVRLPKPRPGLLFGDGKIDEIKTRVELDEIGLVLVDGPVTPVQQRNLEKTWGCKVLDRTGLILEIFADRAQTREGVLQVDLAALSYQRTRLVRAWTHLERQRGGLGFVGGPGETQIEADRRAIDDAVSRIKRQLTKVVKTRSLHRQARKKVPYPIVALVGYTNAGKSTLFNRMTGAEMMAKDMLFATLDPTMRRIDLANGDEVILSDTVGFISDLPTHLVAAFRATLEEVRDADLILHVRDIAHPETEEQAADVAKIVADLGVGDETPVIEVWNKIDLLSEADRATRLTIAERRPDVIAVSAMAGEGLDGLADSVSSILSPPRERRTIDLPAADGRRRAWLYDQGVVASERVESDQITFEVDWTARQAAAFDAL